MIVSDRMGWLDLAECRGLDTALFFPTRGDNRRVDAAKAVCARCPVVADCADHAATQPERFGIWGGVSAGNELKRTRSRAVAS